MTTPLENYLRTHRKRAGLTQHEVSFLVGKASGTKISRYETFSREPNLETLFALEIVFGTAASRLFIGPYVRASLTVRRRARLLAKRLDNTSGNHHPRKLAVLRALAGLEDKNVVLS